MIVDPITEEIRMFRRALAAQHDNDVHRIYEDLRKSERSSGRRFLSLPKRPARAPASVEPPQPLASSAESVAGGAPSPAAQ